MISDPVAVLVVLAAVVYVAIRLEERYALFRSLGSALVGILAGMVLSNAGVIPGESPTYVFLMGPAVSVGIALILFSVDVRTVFSAGPVMLLAFGIGAVGTAMGAAVGGFLWLSGVGPETWKLAGQFTGTYTGGGVNFAALGQALDVSADLFTAATAADVIVTAVWMMACLAAPLVFSRSASPRSGERVTAPDDSSRSGKGSPDFSSETRVEAGPDAEDERVDGGSGTLERALYASHRPMTLLDVAALVTLAIGVMAVSGWLGERVPRLPSVLWLTTLALALAQIPAVRRIAGSAVVGNYLILLFLASNGARSVVANIFHVGPAVVWYALTVVAVHGVVIFGVGRLVRIDAGTLAVASQANVGGPASAMALATARGYGSKLLPGVAVGLAGYALGNYLGFAVAQLLRGALGG
jgi:uncharacterized membrane protein